MVFDLAEVRADAWLLWRCGGMTARDAYLSAAEGFAALLDRLPDGRWDAPALGVWNLRDLVGHAAGAGLSYVVAVLDRPADAEAISSAEGYYALAKSVDPAVYQAAVQEGTEQARRDGAALGEHPARAVHAMLDQVTAKLGTVSDDALLEVHPVAGGMRVDAWLPTRTFELVVHGLDIAAAAGISADFSTDVLADATALAARIAVETGDGVTVLRALTGRGVLPERFSVV